MNGRWGLLALRNAILASQNAITAPRQKPAIPASTPEMDRAGLGAAATWAALCAAWKAD